MASDSFKVRRSLNIEPLSSAAGAAKGDLTVDSGGKLQYHNGTTDSPVVTEAHTATLTNKTISGASNTLSSVDYASLVLTGAIVNADISGSAAITRSKLATGTASHVVIHDGSGNLSSEASLAVTRGGTGAASLTANNVLLGNGTSALQAVAPGSNGNVLTSDGTTWNSTAPVAVAAADDQIWLRTQNGYGSTNTKIPRFTTTVRNTAGAHMTLTQSATDGDSITINTAGIYAVSVTGNTPNGATASLQLGVSVNATGGDLTTNIYDLAGTKRACLQHQWGTSGPDSSTPSSAATLYLAANDVVRMHTNGQTPAVADGFQFIVTRIF
jgi:hypothetical protein